MYELAASLLGAAETGRRFAVATAIAIEGSAPRTVGTSMAFDGSAVVGSIAGGCVEAAVVEVCEHVLADGVARTVEYGYSDETAIDVGLTCGGTLRIHVQLLDDGLIETIQRREPIVTVIPCEGSDPEVFVESPPIPPHLIIFGAMDFSAALAAAAPQLGYRVTVCDPRALFATSVRFPTAELVIGWPPEYLRGAAIDESTAICVLSHDARFDTELIAIALSSSAGYIGAMGSRTTHDRRVASLREAGVVDLDRLHSPIGLDLGASSPAETAIAILAEMLASRTGASAQSLRSTTGAIHRSRKVRAQT